jgi:hypothetical protein
MSEEREIFSCAAVIHGGKEVTMMLSTGCDDDRCDGLGEQCPLEVIERPELCLIVDIDAEEMRSQLDREGATETHRLPNGHVPVTLVVGREKQRVGSGQRDGPRQLISKSVEIRPIEPVRCPERTLMPHRRPPRSVDPPVAFQTRPNGLSEHRQVRGDELKQAMPLHSVTGIVCENGRLGDSAASVENNR